MKNIITLLVLASLTACGGLDENNHPVCSGPTVEGIDYSQGTDCCLGVGEWIGFGEYTTSVDGPADVAVIVRFTGKCGNFSLTSKPVTVVKGQATCLCTDTTETTIEPGRVTIQKSSDRVCTFPDDTFSTGHTHFAPFGYRLLDVVR